MKIHTKKKAHQRHCQVMADRGMVPNADGVWVTSIKPDSAMRSFQAGRRVGMKRGR